MYDYLTIPFNCFNHLSMWNLRHFVSVLCWYFLAYASVLLHLYCYCDGSWFCCLPGTLWAWRRKVLKIWRAFWPVRDQECKTCCFCWIQPTYILLAGFNSSVLWHRSVSRARGNLYTSEPRFLRFPLLDSLDLCHVCLLGLPSFFRKTQTERRPAAQVQRWVQKRELFAKRESRRWNGTQFWATWSECDDKRCQTLGVVTPVHYTENM